MNHNKTTNKSKNKKNKATAFEKLIIKSVSDIHNRNLLLSLQGHFLIYNYQQLTLTCLDCGHKCVCCDDVVIYNTVDSFVNHMKLAHNIDV